MSYPEPGSAQHEWEKTLNGCKHQHESDVRASDEDSKPVIIKILQRAIKNLLNQMKKWKIPKINSSYKKGSKILSSSLWLPRCLLVNLGVKLWPRSRSWVLRIMSISEWGFLARWQVESHHPFLSRKQIGNSQSCLCGWWPILKVAETLERKSTTSSLVLFPFHKGDFLDFPHIVTHCKMRTSVWRSQFTPGWDSVCT